jgi:hypothetical protein
MGNKSRGNFRIEICLKSCKCQVCRRKKGRDYRPETTKPDSVKRKKMPEWMTR